MNGEFAGRKPSPGTCHICPFPATYWMRVATYSARSCDAHRDTVRAELEKAHMSMLDGLIEKERREQGMAR